MFVAVEGELAGIIAVADVLKSNSKKQLIYYTKWVLK